jgi:hypothetical protein
VAGRSTARKCVCRFHQIAHKANPLQNWRPFHTERVSPIFAEGERLEREANYSSSPIAEMKKTWGFYFHYLYGLVLMYGVNDEISVKQCL